MTAMVIIGGHVSREGANAQHALRINAVTILLVQDYPSDIGGDPTPSPAPLVSCPSRGELSTVVDRCLISTVAVASFHADRSHSRTLPSTLAIKKVKVAHTRLPSVGFRS